MAKIHNNKIKTSIKLGGNICNIIAAKVTINIKKYFKS